MFGRKRRNQQQRTYSLTAYTGVGQAPPNRAMPSPAAVSAAGAAGLARSNSTASNLSSAAAATAVRRHSMTSQSSANAEKVRRNIVTRNSQQQLHQPNLAPASPLSTRRNVTRTTSRIENTGRTMSLTTTTIRNMGSFELVTTKTVPLHDSRSPILSSSGSRRLRPGYAASNLSFESDLNPVTEENAFDSIDEKLDNNPSSVRETARSSTSKTVASSSTGSASQPVPSISLSAALDDNRPQSPTAGSHRLHANLKRHEPLPRSASPIKSALRTPSVASSSDEQVTDNGHSNDTSITSTANSNTIKAKKSHHRVSFLADDEFIVDDNPQQDNGPHPQPNIRAAAAQKAASNEKERSVKVSHTHRQNKTSSSAAAVALNGRKKDHEPNDSDSGNSVYSDAFEYNNDADRVLRLDRAHKRLLNGNGHIANVNKYANSLVTNGTSASQAKYHSSALSATKSEGHSHGYRQLAEDESDQMDNDDTISLNSDSSWKRDTDIEAVTRSTTTSTVKGFRSTLRDENIVKEKHTTIASNSRNEKVNSPNHRLSEGYRLSLRDDANSRVNANGSTGLGGFKRLSLREPKIDQELVDSHTKYENQNKLDRNSITPNTARGFRTHSLRGDSKVPEFKNQKSSTAKKEMSSRSASSNREHQQNVKAGGFSRLSLRDDRSHIEQPLKESEFTGLGGLGFTSRFADSDSDESHLEPVPKMPNSGSLHPTDSGSGKLKGVKNILSPNRQVKYLVPKNSSSKVNSDGQQRHYEKHYEQSQTRNKTKQPSAEELAQKMMEQHQFPDSKKKKFPGLRKVFGLK